MVGNDITLPPLETSLVSRFGTVGNELAVGGIPVGRLADRVGATPFFAYDRAALTHRVAQLRAELPHGLEISYAVKANPMPAVVQHLSRSVDCLDVASGGELRVALDTGIEPQNVSFAGPGKSVEELRQAVAAGVVIEVESPLEAERVVRVGDELSVAPMVAIRVNPSFEIKGSGMRMGGGAQQFGIDEEDVPALSQGAVGRIRGLLGLPRLLRFTEPAR